MATKKKPVALFIGRFQPFHRGHLSALRWIAARSSKVVVAIGSAEKSNEPDNPFSEKERGMMIRAQLRSAGLSRKCALAAVTDINDNGKWVAHVDRSVPAYDIAYSNNALVKRLMNAAGKKVLAVPFFRKSAFNATKIRARMKRSLSWHDRVPKKVGELLERMGAERRVRLL
jgi:nicotinamide-nucleotide adenylyltransferase